MIIDGVFSGGGIKGYGLVGALQELKERDLYSIGQPGQVQAP